MTEIVCVSHNAPPMNDAEALCTARLLSALARAGARVQWIARDGPAGLDPDVVRDLLDPSIEVQRVSAGSPGPLRRWLLAMRHRLWAPHLEWVEPAARAARAALARHPGAVLLTRAMPIVSNLVGYRVRRDAAAWVAHWSDPYPPPAALGSRWSRAARGWHRRWASRILRTASGITVTCAQAVRYLREQAGGFPEDRVRVVPHLAVPPLPPAGVTLDRHGGRFVLAHIGNWMALRRPEVLLDGARRAAADCPGLRLVQYGHVDPAAQGCRPRSDLEPTVWVHETDDLDPRCATALRGQADVNVVVDADVGLPYSPFLPSKYPHAVCSGRPLLVVAPADSAMADYTRRFGGGRWAPFDASAVASAIRDLYAARDLEPHPWRPSAELQAQFAEAAVLPPLLDLIERRRGSGRKG